MKHKIAINKSLCSIVHHMPVIKLSQHREQTVRQAYFAPKLLHAQTQGLPNWIQIVVHDLCLANWYRTTRFYNSGDP